jgi:hypothetical protein
VEDQHSLAFAGRGKGEVAVRLVIGHGHLPQ